MPALYNTKCYMHLGRFVMFFLRPNVDSSEMFTFSYISSICHINVITM